MIKFKEWIKGSDSDSWQEIWFRSFLQTCASVTLCFTMFLGVKESFGLKILPEASVPYIVIIVLVVFIIILLLNSFLSSAASSAAHEKFGFHYDGKGILWNGHEPNISFRIETFKAMLASFDHKSLNEIMLEVGIAAGLNFAQKFATDIYPEELQGKNGNNPWMDLTFEEQLTIWAEYDSATGWGLITPKSAGEIIEIDVQHLKLFEGKEGEAFANFLAGYCLTVLKAILKYPEPYSHIVPSGAVSIKNGTAHIMFTIV